ncbi:MAG: twin-arginine translocase TatA/TatE family subunit [Paenibacillaceae bacterium]|nr:twin-arginine translocase TatA/TatE family subunit [Paenibacillaceae bacterium]
MELSGIGPTGIILIVLVALLLFGPSKLPELGRAFGRTLREFKSGAKEMMADDDEKQPRHEIRNQPPIREALTEPAPQQSKPAGLNGDGHG